MSTDFYKATTGSKEVVTRETESGLQLLYNARWESVQRHKDFGKNGIEDENDRDEYLMYIEKELKLRNQVIHHQLFEMGRLLVEAKKELPHGEFGKWIEKINLFSESTARGLMHIYHICLGTPALLTMFKKSLLEVVCRPHFPDELRQYFVDNARGVYDLKVKELLLIQKKFMDGDIDLESDELHEVIKKQRNIDLRKRYVAEWESIRDYLEERKSGIRQMHERQQSHPLLKGKYLVRKFYWKTVDELENASILFNMLIDHYGKDGKFDDDDTDTLDMEQSEEGWHHQPVANCLPVTKEGSLLLQMKNAKKLSKELRHLLDETIEDEYSRMVIREIGPEHVVYYFIAYEEWAVDREQEVKLSRICPDDIVVDEGYAEGQARYEHEKFMLSQLGPDDELYPIECFWYNLADVTNE